MSGIGFIGAGRIGATLAGLAVEGGYDVALSNSRGPESLAEIVAELGPRARASSVADIARDAEFVVLAVPMHAVPGIPAGPLEGIVVADATNYFVERDGPIAGLVDDAISTSEHVQALLPGARVVKAFNHIRAQHILRDVRRPGEPGRRALSVAGDDVAAKRAVAAFIESIGFDVLDLGPLRAGRRVQPGTRAFTPPLDLRKLRERVMPPEQVREIPCAVGPPC